MEYRVLKSEAIEELITEVNSYLSSGWYVQGGIGVEVYRKKPPQSEPGGETKSDTSNSLLNRFGYEDHEEGSPMGVDEYVNQSNGEAIGSSPYHSDLEDNEYEGTSVQISSDTDVRTCFVQAMTKIKPGDRATMWQNPGQSGNEDGGNQPLMNESDPNFSRSLSENYQELVDAKPQGFFDESAHYPGKDLIDARNQLMQPRDQKAVLNGKDLWNQPFEISDPDYNVYSEAWSRKFNLPDGTKGHGDMMRWNRRFSLAHGTGSGKSGKFHRFRKIFGKKSTE